MTWDHIATAIVGGGATLLIVAVAALGWLLFKPLRRGAGRLVLATITILASGAAFAWAGYKNMGPASGEYPGLLAAYEQAPTDRQALMRKIVVEAYPRREVFSFSLDQRDRFLAAGGYCTRTGQSDCRRVPLGSEAEGIAIEVFPYVGRCGRTTECPQAPCTQPGNPRCLPNR